MKLPQIIFQFSNSYLLSDDLLILKGLLYRIYLNQKHIYHSISYTHSIPNYFLGLSLLTIGVAGDFGLSGEGFLFTGDFLANVETTVFLLVFLGVGGLLPGLPNSRAE